jgi:hypothetical protein
VHASNSWALSVYSLFLNNYDLAIGDTAGLIMSCMRNRSANYQTFPINDRCLGASRSCGGCYEVTAAAHFCVFLLFLAYVLAEKQMACSLTIDPVMPIQRTTLGFC